MIFVRLGPYRNREHHFIGVLLLVLFDLLLRQGDKIFAPDSGHEKSAADNVIRHSVVISQGTVHGKTQQLSFVVADNANGFIEGINGLNRAAYDLLHNFKTLGPKYGKQMKQIAALVAGFSQDQIAAIEASAETLLDVDGEKIPVPPADFEITSEDMPGWLVATEGKLTVALDITITDDLRAEGIARELINRIQNIRKDSGFEVTDKIRVEIEQQEFVLPALKSFADYIASQTLAVEIEGVPSPSGEFVVESEVDEQPVRIAVTKICA